MTLLELRRPFLWSQVLSKHSGRFFELVTIGSVFGAVVGYCVVMALKAMNIDYDMARRIEEDEKKQTDMRVRTFGTDGLFATTAAEASTCAERKNDDNSVVVASSAPAIGTKAKGKDKPLLLVPAVCAPHPSRRFVSNAIAAISHRMYHGDQNVLVLRNDPTDIITDLLGRNRLNSANPTQFRLERANNSQFHRQSHMIDSVQGLIGDGRVIARRAIYYLYSNRSDTSNLFNHSEQVVQSIRHLANSARVPLRSLSITSGSCGLFAGPCTIRNDDRCVYDGLPGVLSLTEQNLGDVLDLEVRLKTCVQCIMFFETEGFLISAIQLRFVQRHCLCFTGRGFPDHLTLHFLRSMLDTYPHMSLCVFTDMDPSGVSIARGILYGGRMAVESYLYAAFEGHYAGLVPWDLKPYGFDAKLLQDIDTVGMRKTQLELDTLARRWSHDVWRLFGSDKRREHLINEHKRFERTLNAFVRYGKKMPMEAIMLLKDPNKYLEDKAYSWHYQRLGLLDKDLKAQVEIIEAYPRDWVNMKFISRDTAICGTIAQMKAQGVIQ